MKLFQSTEWLFHKTGCQCNRPRATRWPQCWTGNTYMTGEWTSQQQSVCSIYPLARVIYPVWHVLIKTHQLSEALYNLWKYTQFGELKICLTHFSVIYKHLFDVLIHNLSQIKYVIDSKGMKSSFRRKMNLNFLFFIKINQKLTLYSTDALF